LALAMNRIDRLTRRPSRVPSELHVKTNDNWAYLFLLAVLGSPAHVS
jgi:hypothetical protein